MQRATRVLQRARHIKMQRANIHGNTEGATAESKGWNDKEKAVENMWARQAEAEKIKALKNVLAEQRKTTDAIKKELDEMSKKQA
ncbi:hypothetical protein BDB00DRAFT_871410 [Zychaea mexicana]|uniref:uncharacterized protein n=1 Tax=Zychaea mexicana TaxID=64656 RepID=UPI0022FDD35A|nr:uncharacterized protein BDB00DRAFT_871410 [Zychaea mexicana]KAI9494319.1 hypothetical protein BDB00DRAFT_871410 [Zychaea mexicana]